MRPCQGTGDEKMPPLEYDRERVRSRTFSAILAFAWRGVRLSLADVTKRTLVAIAPVIIYGSPNNK